MTKALTLGHRVRELPEVRVRVLTPRGHPGHGTLTMVLACSTCARIFWEHQDALRAKEG